MLVLAGCVADTYLAGPWDAAVPACGNALLEAGETCDDGNRDDGDGCSTTCTLEEDCADLEDNDGDGLVDCADAADCADDPACQPVCGDGVLDPGEGCDDGNTTPGDGCSATCDREAELDCSDRIDDNADGLIDCADATCEGRPCLGAGTACRGGDCGEGDCADGIDNDRNGQVDCSDAACAASPDCQ
jgi:cysteine-rich repeat protein